MWLRVEVEPPEFPKTRIPQGLKLKLTLYFVLRCHFLALTKSLGWSLIQTHKNWVWIKGIWLIWFFLRNYSTQKNPSMWMNQIIKMKANPRLELSGLHGMQSTISFSMWMNRIIKMKANPRLELSGLHGMQSTHKNVSNIKFCSWSFQVEISKVGLIL